MRNRALPLALLIAASLAPVAGCSDNDSDSTSGHSNDLAAEQSSSASDPSSGSPLPVNDPDASQDAHQAGADPSSNAQQLQQLQQQVRSLTQAATKRTQRLDDQDKRIKKLENTVQDLKTRLRRLPQPKTPAADAPTSGRDQKAGTPDAVSPQSDDSDSGDDNAASGSAESSDDDSASTAAASESPPSNAHRVRSCSVHHPTREQFDVFFQAATSAALGNATDAVKSAHLSDWFATPRKRRLYVGRYGRCPTAERRRQDVSSRTGLDLRIAAVMPHVAHQPALRGHTSSSHAHDYGASREPRSRHRSRPMQPAIQPAPFRIIGVEIRGTHHYLGVAPQGDTRLGGVTWLTPGDRYGGWQLRNIRTDSGRAVFSDGQRTIAVALPARG